MPRAWIVLVLVVAICVVGRPAAAQDDATILVLPFSGEELSAEQSSLPAKLTEALAVLIRASGGVATVAQESLADSAMLLGCDTEEVECLQSLADTMGAKTLMFGEVSVGEDTVVVVVTRFESGADPVIETYKFPGMGLDAIMKKFVELVASSYGFDVPEDEPIEKEVVEPKRDVVLIQAPPSGFSLGRVKTSTWAIIGTGAVAVAVGAVLQIKSGSIRTDIDNAPRDTVEELEDLEALEKRGKQYYQIGGGLLIGGGIVVATGLTLAILQGASSPKAQERPIAVVPMPVRGGIGVAVTFRRLP